MCTDIPLLEEASAHPATAQRCLLRALGDCAKAALDLLAGAARHADGGVREAAAVVLTHWKPLQDEAVRLLQHLVEDECASVRSAVLFQLGTLDEVPAALQGALMRVWVAHPALRTMCRWALSSVRGSKERAVQRAFAALSEDSVLQKEALRLLHSLSVPVPRLIARLESMDSLHPSSRGVLLAWLALEPVQLPATVLEALEDLAESASHAASVQASLALARCTGRPLRWQAVEIVRETDEQEAVGAALGVLVAGAVYPDLLAAVSARRSALSPSGQRALDALLEGAL